MINIFNILLKQWHMENIMDLIVKCNAGWQTTRPTLSRIFKGPQYQGANLAHDSILKELLLDLMHKYTYSSTWNSLNIMLWFV